VATRTAIRANALEAALTQRGFGVSRSADVHADAVLSYGVQPPPGTRIAYDVPFDVEGLLALEREDGLVMVEPREIPHLRQIARRAGRELHAVGRERPGRDVLAAFRADIRRALREDDLELHLTALEPLFAEFPAEEVAAALSVLARRRAPAPSAQSRAASGATPFVRVFVSMGQRDGIRPNDLVGVITAEAGIPGERIGKIEIRDSFSVLEIDPEAAQTVIRKLNGTTVRGRSLRVDYDRRPAARSATPRRRASRPPT
jgi:ATP-dependent RNA helicase DeaD